MASRRLRIRIATSGDVGAPRLIRGAQKKVEGAYKRFGNVRAAAEHLGMAKSTFADLCKKHDVDTPCAISGCKPERKLLPLGMDEARLRAEQTLTALRTSVLDHQL